MCTLYPRDPAEELLAAMEAVTVVEGVD